MGGSDSRLTTEILPERGRRLRLAALVDGKPVKHYLDDLLDRHLPTAEELADAIRGPHAAVSDRDPQGSVA